MLQTRGLEILQNENDVKSRKFTESQIFYEDYKIVVSVHGKRLPNFYSCIVSGQIPVRSWPHIFKKTCTHVSRLFSRPIESLEIYFFV